MLGLELCQVVLIGLLLLFGIGISTVSLLRVIQVYLLLSNKGEDFFLDDSFYNYFFHMFIVVSIFWFLIAGVSFAIINYAIPEAIVLSIFILCYVIINFTNEKGILK